MTDAPKPTHTPEPWGIEITGNYVWYGPLRPDGKIEHIVGYNNFSGCVESFKSRCLADARRIVACVNACTGMTDPVAEIAALREKAAKWDAIVAMGRLRRYEGGGE